MKSPMREKKESSAYSRYLSPIMPPSPFKNKNKTINEIDSKNQRKSINEINLKNKEKISKIPKIKKNETRYTSPKKSYNSDNEKSSIFSANKNNKSVDKSLLEDSKLDDSNVSNMSYLFTS
jgi:hypothetical protein